MMKKRKETMVWRILRILIMVIIGLIIIFGAYYAYSKNKISLSPPNCEVKVWCLDYNTISIRENNCVVTTKDCSDSERCLNGECVLRN